MVNKSIINMALEYVNQIPSELKVSKAFLFGSFAKGLENENSDIDIAIVVGNMTNFFSTQMQLMKVRRNIDLRIEPHPISISDFTNNNPFVSEILKSGVELEINKNTKS